jgi:hypothetical protein
MDEDPHWQLFVIDQGLDLAALDPLACIVTRLVVGTAAFSAGLTD